ncbi:MAG: hypothetical protein GC179_30360 [Anaerolineaceae bacterium]|nr:hypothetical protein [Anaerolineaceae bacterium]
MTQPNLISGNTWVLAKDTTGRLQKDRAALKASGEHLIGYIYVDHQAGVSLMVHRLCKIGLLRGINVTGDLEKLKIGWTLRYEVLIKFEMQRMTNDQVHSFGLPTRPDYMDIYDNNEEYRKLRHYSVIDRLRAPGFPDDIKFAMIAPGRKIEEVWGRLERRIGEITFECELLNTPYQDFGVKAGDRIVVRLETVPAGLIANYICPMTAIQQFADKWEPHKW